VRVRRWPRPDRAAPPPRGDALVDDVVAAWHAAEAWLVDADARHHLFWLRDDTLHDVELEPLAALVGAALADGETPPEPAPVVERAARRLAALLT
jgi:hypothetical protein